MYYTDDRILIFFKLSFVRFSFHASCYLSVDFVEDAKDEEKSSQDRKLSVVPQKAVSVWLGLCTFPFINYFVCLSVDLVTYVHILLAFCAVRKVSFIEILV
jgi:hypothetical protein